MSFNTQPYLFSKAEISYIYNFFVIMFALSGSKYEILSLSHSQSF